MSEPIIKVKDLTFKYPKSEKPALKNVSFEVMPGEFVAIMGRNGAGKTTLCLTMNGIIPTVINGEYQGEVIIDGMSTRKKMVYELAQKIGITLQDPETQIFCPDVQSEIAFGPENLGVPREEILRRMDFALEVTRLQVKRDMSPSRLSGGQKQRVALAAAITLQPSIMVMDEPTSQLDPIGTEDVFNTVRGLNKEQGITIMMAEHKSEEIAEFADKILVLDEGEVVMFDEPHKVFDEEETLKKIHVKIPRVTQLSHFLKRGKGIPVDAPPIKLEEGETFLNRLLEQNVIRYDPTQHKPPEMRLPVDEPIIEVTDLHHVYATGTHALKGIDLNIYKGDFVAIIGQNGAGKSTLVKHFVGSLRPTRGQVKVFGEDISALGVGEISTRVGLVLQNPDYMLFEDTVKDEIAFGPRNLGLSPEEVEQRVQEAIKVVDLKCDPGVFPLRLSMGDRRKVSVASIYAMHPDIFILDEPTTGQDFRSRYDIVEIAARLNNMGKTVIMITHDMDLVAKYAQRTIVMGLGRILLDGPTPQVFAQSEILKATYIKPPQITQLFQRLSKYSLPRWVRSTTEAFELITGTKLKEEA
ncbi:MAG: ABC transporter ATP-binding protein [Candidatus Ranarchaeia archaeon]